MTPFITVAAMADRVQLLICAGCSVAVSIEPAQAEQLAADLLRVAHEARARRLAEVTRPMCRACWRDCSACVCGERGAA